MRKFPACLRVSVRGLKKLFVSREDVLSYSFSCKYGGRGWRRSIPPPGSSPPRCRFDSPIQVFLSPRNLGQSPTLEGESRTGRKFDVIFCLIG